MATPNDNSNTVHNQTEILSTPSKQSCFSKVRVIVRVRPFLPQEISLQNGKPTSCVSVLDSNHDSSNEVSVHLKDQETSRNECYKLDAFFGQEDNNVTQIFNEEVKPFIPWIFQGYNATIFAYGATGSGKTYTMQGSEEKPGLMPLVISTILSLTQTRGTKTKIQISYYEVYMDKCYDLLELKKKEISILDDKNGQTHLKGLGQVEIKSMSDFQEVFSRAIKRRKVAYTCLNDVSSRSHGALVIYISTPCEDGSGNFVTGKLNLIDLAGNEDNRKTNNEGIRIQESSKINQSLFALSNVIYALNNNKPRIPYRESKLTRILQDSLGGKSHALMVACLNPGEYQESVHTVSLAARSRNISNFISPNQRNNNSLIKINMEEKLKMWLESKGKINRGTYSAKTVQSSSVRSSVVKTYTRGTFNAKEKKVESRSRNVACRNLFEDDSSIKAQNSVFNGISEDKFEFTDGALFKLDISTVNLEEKIKLSTPCIQEDKDLVSPLRKVLSPINPNISSKDQICPVTPLPQPGTPLDKFHSRSCNLKNSLVQEYVEFLNSASREELLELKGIGEKMAEYIMELRDTSPLKCLKDLEKIGLSSKQVHNMFGKAAREMLGCVSIQSPII